MTPKLKEALSLILDVLNTPGEQVIVFAALRAQTDALARWLQEAGVRLEVMDGRVSPTKRGAISRRFKAKEFPVLLCGSESCSEGHSWPQASTMIILCETWAMDKWLQSISRVHRLTSTAPVTVYSLVVEGSLDEYLARLRSEKVAAAGAVLDGDSIEDDADNLSPAALIKAARDEFEGRTEAVTVDEEQLLAEWPALRSRLTLAMRQWARPLSIFSTSNEEAKMDIAKAMAADVQKPDEPWVADLPLWKLAA